MLGAGAEEQDARRAMLLRLSKEREQRQERASLRAFSALDLSTCEKKHSIFFSSWYSCLLSRRPSGVRRMQP